MPKQPQEKKNQPARSGKGRGAYDEQEEEPEDNSYAKE
jgi:hypothetical protein